MQVGINGRVRHDCHSHSSQDSSLDATNATSKAYDFDEHEGIEGRRKL